MKAPVPALGTTLALERPAARVVSLVSSATETLFALGAGEAVVGVTPWCARYVPGLAAPVVAEYVAGDPAAIAALRPDLVVATDGVQLPLARRLAAAGLPVYLLPVPRSRAGILENTIALGALAGRLAEARALVVERGWDRAFAPRVAVSTVERGRNLIHDGPSFVETARWLRSEIERAG